MLMLFMVARSLKVREKIVWSSTRTHFSFEKIRDPAGLSEQAFDSVRVMDSTMEHKRHEENTI